MATFDAKQGPPVLLECVRKAFARPSGRRSPRTLLAGPSTCRIERFSFRTQRLTNDGVIVEVSMVSTVLVNEAGQVFAIATAERPQG
jgi:hypothetical protein